MRHRLTVGLLLFALVSAAHEARGQASSSDAPVAPAATAAAAGAAAGTGLLRVFLDCERFCDNEYVRQSVGFVDHVLDRTVADIHVLVTSQTSGGGGLSWTVRFIGIGRLQGQTSTLTFDTPSTATPDERRNAFLRIFRLGLASQAAATVAAPQLNVTWTAPRTPSGRAAETEDPWNYWVFNTRVNGSMNGESSTRSVSHNLFLTANRVTDKMKLTTSASMNTNKTTFEFDGSGDVVSRRHSWNVGGRAVKSLTPHWSTGVLASVSHSSFNNLDRAVSFAPAVEFNVFPYSESSRRSLTVYYANGVLLHKYTAETIFDRLEATYARHSVGSSLGLQQPWGQLNMSARFSQYLADLDRYNASLSSSADVRLFRGFSFNVFGSYERVKDQVSLRKGTASEQDVLLRLQQLATDYEYYLSFGITYRFGSIFNNIVNTRFDELFF